MDSLKDKQYQPIRDILDYALRPLYIHDSYLQKICPDVMDRMLVAKYFAHDLLHCRVNPFLQGMQVFIGPPSSAAYPLHLNEADVPLHMWQIWGRKSWAMIPRQWCDESDVCTDQLQKLVQIPGQQYLFTANALHTNLTQHPELADVQGYQVVVQPGEVLYMPEGTIHQVENIDAGMAIGVKSAGIHSAKYILDLIDKNLLPYCRDLNCDEHRERAQLMRSSVENFISTGTGSHATLHSAQAPCRQNEGSKDCLLPNPEALRESRDGHAAFMQAAKRKGKDLERDVALIR